MKPFNKNSEYRKQNCFNQLFPRITGMLLCYINGIFHFVRTQNFPKKHFLPPDTYTYTWVSGGKKWKFCVRTKWMIPNGIYSCHLMACVNESTIPIGPFLYPLKTSENLFSTSFLMFLGAEKGCIENDDWGIFETLGKV